MTVKNVGSNGQTEALKAASSPPIASAPPIAKSSAKVAANADHRHDLAMNTAQRGADKVVAKKVPAQAVSDQSGDDIVLTGENVENNDVLPEQNIQLAMLDTADAASFGGSVEEMAVKSDGQAASAETAADDDDKALGIGTTPLIIGGVALLGGGIAIAAGGGGKENRAPTLNASQAVTTPEDTKVTVTVAATDPDGDSLTFTASGASKGTVTGSGNSFVYTPNANFNGTDSFTVTASDGKGGSATQTVNVTVSPVNDLPVAQAATAKVNEDASVTGQLVATDIDNGAVLAYTLDAPVAGLAVASGGAFTFDASNAVYQSLAAGETKDVVANYTVTDDKGATSKSTLTVTVTGVNDAPSLAAAQTVATKEDTLSVSFTVVATDIDNGDVVTLSAPTLSAQGGTVAGGADGKFTYAPLPNFNGTDTVIVTATDKSGAKSTQTVTFTVESDPNETQSIDVVSDATPTTYDAAGIGFTAGDNFKFTDNSGQPTNARILNFTKGDTIEVTGASADYSFSATGSDLSITFNNTAAGVLNQIVLVNALAGFTGFVSDEASAEAALGHNFFSALTLPAGGGASGLDVDNDGDITTPAPFSAAGADVAFTEDANIANTAAISGFGIGDTITVANASPGTYSFSSSGTDISITANVAGVVSSITLLNANPGAVFVSDEASAEAAVGSNFFLFGSTPPAPPPAGTVGQSIDNGAALTTLNAATAGFNFTDDAARETNVIITSFTSDDRIAVSGANSGQYSFGTGTDPNDLQITFNNTSAGVANVIILDDVLVGKSDFIFDYDTARTALGFDFMTFA